jgi:chemotaxis protein MotB
VAGKDSNQPVIIIKKKKGGGHDAHHGGAWKVAYADFVTAMMAFFLLLWLLNVTTSEQRQGIADYFTPVSVSKSTSGSGGLLGGLVITVPGAQISASSNSVIEDIPSQGRPGFASEAVDGAEEPTSPEGDPNHQQIAQGRDGTQDGSGTAGNTAGTGNAGNQIGTGIRFMSPPQNVPASQGAAQMPPGPRGTVAGTGNANVDPAALERLEQTQREQAAFQAAEAQLRQAIQAVPDLQVFQQNLVIDQTPEGLRIQIVDQEGNSMFPSGSAQVPPQTRQLLSLVAQAVRQLPNRLSVSGHTDGTPFNRQNYDNWDLSTDRANSSRRALLAAGVADTRFSTVVGRADREPLVPESPNSPRNRRISIVLLSQLDPQGGGGAGAPAQPPAGTAPAAPPQRAAVPAPAAPAPAATAPQPGGPVRLPGAAPASAPTPPPAAPPVPSAQPVPSAPPAPVPPSSAAVPAAQTVPVAGPVPPARPPQN